MGVGTPSPSSSLHLFNPANVDVVATIESINLRSPYLLINHPSRRYRVGANISVASAFEIYDENATANRLVIQTNGNVGIGTTTDAGFRLDVNGTARVSGDLTSTGSFITTSQVGYSNNSRTITFNDAFAGLNYQGFGGHRFKSYNSSTALYVEMITLVGNQSNLRVGINSPTPNSSAILDVVSTDKGFLPPPAKPSGYDRRRRTYLAPPLDEVRAGSGQ